MQEHGLAVLQIELILQPRRKNARKLTDPTNSTTRNGNLEALVGIKRVVVGRPLYVKGR